MINYTSTWREILENDLAYIEKHFEGASIGLLPHEEDTIKWSDEFQKLDIHSFNDREFQAYLDREFDNGYGHVKIPPFQIYTKDYVFAAHDYDGQEGYVCIPRNPNSSFIKKIAYLSDHSYSREYLEEQEKW